jgi:uncharacterized protein YjeT (DUF2065 family)
MSKLVLQRSKTNHITFPSELREAIPKPPISGRVLVLDGLTAGLTPARFGSNVSLKLLVKETGKLKGKYTILVDLQPEAARALAETLTQLADQAEPIHSKM